MNRHSRTALWAGLVVTGMLDACTFPTDPLYLQADVTTLDAAEWVSCNDSGCRFKGQGLNEGPDCAREVWGVVGFADKDSLDVVSLSTRQAARYEWRPDPANSTLEPGKVFPYLTVGRVPKVEMDQVASFSSNMTTGKVVVCPG